MTRAPSHTGRASVPVVSQGDVAARRWHAKRVDTTTAPDPANAPSAHTAPTVAAVEPQPTTRTEWLVTGEPGTHRGVTYPHYRHIWRDDTNPHAGHEAREFVATMRERDNWADGPHLYSRLVIETPWEPADE
jgi:hypothetical protein